MGSNKDVSKNNIKKISSKILSNIDNVNKEHLKILKFDYEIELLTYTNNFFILILERILNTITQDEFIENINTIKKTFLCENYYYYYDHYCDLYDIDIVSSKCHKYVHKLWLKLVDTCEFKIYDFYLDKIILNYDDIYLNSFKNKIHMYFLYI